MTEEKIKKDSISGQNNLENTHRSVGHEVREFVIKNTGKTPESLPVQKQIPKVQSEIKKGYRKMIKEDMKK